MELGHSLELVELDEQVLGWVDDMQVQEDDKLVQVDDKLVQVPHKKVQVECTLEMKWV